MVNVLCLGKARVYMLSIFGKMYTFANREAKRLFG